MIIQVIGDAEEDKILLMLLIVANLKTSNWEIERLPTPDNNLIESVRVVKKRLAKPMDF